MLEEVRTLLWAGLSLEPRTFNLIDTPSGFRNALTLFTLAVFSKSLGEAGILYINRSTKMQYFRGLLASLTVLAAAAVIWSGCIWLSGRIALGLNLEYKTVGTVILVSYFPLVFSFLAIVPHLGLLSFRVLSVWGLLITVAGLEHEFGLTVYQGLSCSAAGWIVFYLLNSAFGGAAERVRLRLLGRESWVKPKEAAIALLEREMKRK